MLIVTPDNRVILTDRSRSPLVSLTSTRFELDRNNNLSRTENLTNYPENRFDIPTLPAQAIPRLRRPDSLGGPLAFVFILNLIIKIRIA